MNLSMFLAKLKLKSLLLIALMTLKSIWKKMLNLLLATYTLFWHLNKRIHWGKPQYGFYLTNLISSPHGVLVLFFKNKHDSLYLCVNFHSLKHISKKDCNPLLLISDLLDSSYKAWVYSKINLCHAYYLVYIVNSDEWKTAFRTYYRSFEWFVIPFSLTNASVAFQ